MSPSAQNAVRDFTFGHCVVRASARAREAAPQFEMNADNRAAVIEICRRLDGIPLAIEFAAARLPLLGVEGLRLRRPRDCSGAPMPTFRSPALNVKKASCARRV